MLLKLGVALGLCIVLLVNTSRPLLRFVVALLELIVALLHFSGALLHLLVALILSGIEAGLAGTLTPAASGRAKAACCGRPWLVL